MQFSGTGCSCDVTWIEVRHRYQDLHWGDKTWMEVRCESKGPGRKWDGISREGSITSPNLDGSHRPVELQHFRAGWRGHGQDGGETRILAPGCV